MASPDPTRAPAPPGSPASRSRPAQPSDPAARPGGILCPYCGHISANPRRCEKCAGHFDPLSRQASQNAMGPWFLRDTGQPFRPGCSYETLRDLIKRGRVNRNTVLRGPTTRQFWSFAGRTPSVANLLGVCHNCASDVEPDSFACKACGAAFSPDMDRQHLGLAPVHLLPGQAAPEIIAAAAASEAGRPLPQKARPRAAIAAAPAAERKRISGAMIGAGIAVCVVIAACVGLVLWALDAPVPAPRPQPPATDLAQQPAAPRPEPAPETPPPQPAATEPAPAPGTEEASEPPPAAPAETEEPPAPPQDPGLLAEFNAPDLDPATFRAKVDALYSAARISEAERRGWHALLDRREEQNRLHRLP